MKHVKWLYEVVSLSVVGGLISAPALAIDLAPHQITYQLQLQDAEPETAIEAITGKTIFRLAKECDGWKSGEDYVMQMAFEDGNEILMASLFESFEDEDGRLFSFTIDERSNYEDPLYFTGFAQQDKLEKNQSISGEAYFSIAPDDAITLPNDTYFPVAQTAEILRRARAGETFFTSHIFFGAKPDDALKKTSVIIGKLQDARENTLSLNLPPSKLLQDKVYPVQVAYFDPKSTNGVPAYEISFQMQDNGVVPSYVIDYGDFRLQATMSDIAKEPSPTCG